LSPLAAVVAGGVLDVAGVLLVAVLLDTVVFEVLLVEDVSDPPQAANSSAQDTESIRGTKVFLSIQFSLKFRPARLWAKLSI
jgi:hypothetical protein